MAKTITDQAIALAAMAQAASIVHHIATGKDVDDTDCDTLIYSLFQFNPERTSDVYRSDHTLATGKNAAKILLGSSKSKPEERSAIMRYCAGVIRLAKSVQKDTELAGAIATRLEHSERFLNEFSEQDSNRYSNLAGVYSDTLSKLPQRIQVHGDAERLKNRANADKIRTILLCGVRAALLWMQCGGRRLNFIFQRTALVKAIEQL